jgi:Domain of unknown function (DUF4398)
MVRRDPLQAHAANGQNALMKERELMLLKRFVWILVGAPLALACSESWPEPKQPMADAEAAARSAREVGAETQPAANLKVTLADEQIAAAKARIAKDDNERATFLIIRAKADAELALALAHEQNALNAKQKAVEESKATLDASAQGAKP